jgi:hypothetical protein
MKHMKTWLSKHRLALLVVAIIPGAAIVPIWPTNIVLLFVQLAGLALYIYSGPADNAAD